MQNKKGSVVIIILILLIIIIVIAWLVSLSGRECEEDNDCLENHYCGSDFTCHEHPVIEKEVTKNRLLGPSIILGLCVIISAVILRYKKKEISYYE